MKTQYDYFKKFHSNEWDAVERALKDLVANDDITLKTPSDYVVGSILEEIYGNCPDTYDPEFGDDRVCECGDRYYRHFDSYEEMKPVGCKYSGGCGCEGFKEATAFEQGVFAAKHFFTDVGDIEEEFCYRKRHLTEQSDIAEWEKGWKHYMFTNDLTQDFPEFNKENP